MSEERTFHPLPASDSVAIDDVKRSLRDLPPAHYLLEIDSFSDLKKILKETGGRSYKSETFEAGGYKWILSLYPNGDEERNGKGYISMYLVIADTNALPLGWEVYASFKFFIYDHIHDKFLKVQGALKRVRCFNRLKTEWGFAQLISQSTFHDSSYGYLILDKCAFGAEVSLSCLGKGERLTPMKNFSSYYTWKINQFSSSKQGSCYSEIFTLADLKWKLELRPQGTSHGADKYLSLYLYLEESKAPDRVYAGYKVSILHQYSNKDWSRSGYDCFTDAAKAWGWHQYISLKEINDTSNGFLVNDTLIIEVQIKNLSTLQSFS